MSTCSILLQILAHYHSQLYPRRLYKDHESVFVSLEPMMWYPTIVTLLTGQHQKVITCSHHIHGNGVADVCVVI